MRVDVGRDIFESGGQGRQCAYWGWGETMSIIYEIEGGENDNCDNDNDDGNDDDNNNNHEK